MKKLIAVLLAAALLLSLCACATNPLSGPRSIKGLPPTEAVNTAFENSKRAKSFRENGTMTVGFSATGLTLELKLLQSIEYTTDPDAMHMKLTMDMGILGKQEMEAYYVTENGEPVAYTNATGSWERTEDEPIESTELMSVDVSAAMEYEEIGREDIDGDKCIHYVGKIPGDKLPEMLGSSGDLFSIFGIDVHDPEAMNSLGDLELHVWVSEKRVLPIRYRIDMSSLMQELMSVLMSGAMGDSGIDIHISDCIFEINFTDINEVEDITVPEEILTGSEL